MLEAAGADEREAAQLMAEEFLTENLPDADFTAAKPGTSTWSSCVRLVNPIEVRLRMPSCLCTWLVLIASMLSIPKRNTRTRRCFLFWREIILKLDVALAVGVNLFFPQPWRHYQDQ